MNANAPSVMVSSTFYDLRQIRADLAHFLEHDLGYRALLSEHSSFPIDPDADTVENCRRRVERDADILVLVIGGRYGYIDQDSQRSITNLEYLAARAKGIPIYAFVEKGVLSMLPVWERNPGADFSHVVPDTRLFEFLENVRTVDKVWMHDFERAQEIVATLRAQFAYLMREGLRTRHRLSQQPNQIPEGLSGKAARLVLEKPDTWEYRLFLQAVIDEVSKRKDLRREHRLNLLLGSGDYVGMDGAISWLQARLEELERMSKAFNIVMDQSLQEALGPPGVPGDAEALVFSAQQLGAIYHHALDWAQRVRRAYLPECFRPVAQEMSVFTEDIIERVEEFGPSVLGQIEEALSMPHDGTQRVIEATLEIDLRNLERFEAALAQAERDCFGA